VRVQLIHSRTFGRLSDESLIEATDEIAGEAALSPGRATTTGCLIRWQTRPWCRLTLVVCFQGQRPRCCTGPVDDRLPSFGSGGRLLRYVIRA
jgi:hypothetical protein